MFQPDSFLYECDAETGVATVTLNRPERLNALTFEVYDELRRQADQFVDLADLEDEICRNQAERVQRNRGGRDDAYDQDYDLQDADDMSEL